MSTQADNVNFAIKPYQMVSFNIDVTNSKDVGTTGITQSRFSIPDNHFFIPMYVAVGADPIVGSGASLAIGTDDVATDPDNILDTTAVTGLDATDDFTTIAAGTTITNVSGSALPIYYNVTTAAITSGIVEVVGVLGQISSKT